MTILPLLPQLSESSILAKFLNFIGPSRITSMTGKSTMSPTLGPELLLTPRLAGLALSLDGASTPSFRSEPPTTSRASSVSIPFEDCDVDVIQVEGLKHANVKLEARKYKTSKFAEQLLELLHIIKAPSWVTPEITPSSIKIQKVSGSLTNAVYFVSCPSVQGTRTLLLRIYGPSSGSLISRPRELRILHALSSQYRIGPRLYGTFENGRIEEYFDSYTLSANDLRDRKISSWIGARMAELHSVDLAVIEQSVGEGSEPYFAVDTNFDSWLVLAREVLQLPTVSEEVRAALDLDTLEEEWKRYRSWVDTQESTEGPSKRVFSHNDAQYGNLLRLKTLKEGLPEHRQIVVVDFEYSSPNPDAFDIANHFHEWTANYHSDTPHILNLALYPSLRERRNFYRSYLTHSSPSLASSPQLLDAATEALERQVRIWSPSSHAMWAVWGIVQARETLEGEGEVEFDYLGYARCRIDAFRAEIRALGV